MNVLMASTSTVYGSDYLSYLTAPVGKLFKGAEEILFIPLARPGGLSYDEYTEKARKGLGFLDTKIVGLHEKPDPKKAIKEAKAIFTGGGNTFLLVTRLHELGLMSVLRDAINQGTPYLGTSAGTNICGPTMMTTNDMPIIYPPSFETLGIVPFNINPHYLDPDPGSKHKGETRETRLKEFQTLNDTDVVGLREGSWLEVTDSVIILQGDLKARVFAAGEDPREISTKTDLKQLI